MSFNLIKSKQSIRDSKKYPPNYVGLIQNNSGIIRVETCLTGIAKLARAKGATIVTSKKASIIPNGVTETPTQLQRVQVIFSAEK
ncbi:hypothetical protein EBQ74_09655 [bacterium]|nr:hypothetical protein [bacterium]